MRSEIGDYLRKKPHTIFLASKISWKEQGTLRKKETRKVS